MLVSLPLLLSRLSLIATALLFLLTLLLALLALRLVFLTPLFTAATSSLRAGDICGAQQRSRNRQRQSKLF